MYKRTALGIALAALVAFAGSTAWAGEGDAAAGEKTFRKCKVCHTVEEGGKNKIGPNLFGLFGKTAGTVDGYKYSSAMKESGVVWDETTLDQYLTKPADFIAKTKMRFAGLKSEEDRANVIAYLKRVTQ